MDDLRAGVYRHYKGPLYLVLGLAHDANAGELYSNRSGVARSSDRTPLGEREVVVYVGLQLDDAHTGARLAVRTLDDFLTEVCPSLTCSRYGRPHVADKRYDHDEVPRFAYVGVRWEG